MSKIIFGISVARVSRRKADAHPRAGVSRGSALYTIAPVRCCYRTPYRFAAIAWRLRDIGMALGGNRRWCWHDGAGVAWRLRGGVTRRWRHRARRAGGGAARQLGPRAALLARGIYNGRRRRW
jgi:hypothetical protein